MIDWTALRILLGVRHTVLRRTVEESPNALLWTLLMTGALALVALGRGNELAAVWAGNAISAKVNAPTPETSLERTWLLMQSFWLVALLLPGGLTLLGRTPARAILRPFALTSWQILVAETMAGLLDLPGVLAILLMVPFLAMLIAAGSWAQALVALVSFGLLGLQTGLFARLLSSATLLGWRRVRRLAELPGMATLLLCLLCIGMPPAFASLTTPSSYAQRFSQMVGAISPGSRPALVFRSSTGIARLLPSHQAAHAVYATRQGDIPSALGALGTLTCSLLVTGFGAGLALHRLDRTELMGANRGSPGSSRRSGNTARYGSYTRNRHQSSDSRTAEAQSVPHPLRALCVTEMRLLLRGPHLYLPLRKPASLLLLSVFAFLSPDMGKNPLYNVEEFLGIGGILYTFLWQLQLLCNRFGNEADTSVLLFGFSLSRRLLLAGKNLALLLMLLALDAPAVAVLALVAEAPAQIPHLLFWLPMILLVLTAVGNLVSVRFPFAIAHSPRNMGQEPPDSLLGLYLLVIGATVILLLPVGWLLGTGILGGIAALLYLGGLYTLSLFTTGKTLENQETNICRTIHRTIYRTIHRTIG